MNTELFNGYDSFESYVKNIDIEFYNWMTPSQDIEEDLLERRNFYTEKIMTLIECIDNYIGGYELFSNHTFTGVIDKVIEILYLLITIFKSYTIDMRDSSIVLKIDDKNFNQIRTFDELLRFDIYDKLSMRVSLQDVYTQWIILKFDDKIEINDKLISITE